MVIPFLANQGLMPMLISLLLYLMFKKEYKFKFAILAMTG